MDHLVLTILLVVHAGMILGEIPGLRLDRAGVLLGGTGLVSTPLALGGLGPLLGFRCCKTIGDQGHPVRVE